VGRKSGLTDREILAIKRGDDAGFTDAERVLLNFADRMTETPVEVDDALFAAMRHHFTEEQILELTSTIAWENYRARANHALGIGSDELYCVLPERTEAKAG